MASAPVGRSKAPSAGFPPSAGSETVPAAEGRRRGPGAPDAWHADMNEEPTIAASLAGESPAALADIHDESARDNGLLAEANGIIDALPWGQASILRRAFRVASKYGGMDPVEAQAVSGLVRDSCIRAAMAA